MFQLSGFYCIRPQPAPYQGGIPLDAPTWALASGSLLRVLVDFKVLYGLLKGLRVTMKVDASDT